MDFTERQERARRKAAELRSGKKPLLWIGMATCGLAAGAGELFAAVRDHLRKRKIPAHLIPTGCIGPCFLEPFLDLEKPGRPRISYAEMTPEKARRVIDSYLRDDDPRPDLALGTIGEGEIPGIPRFFDLPMLKSQVRIATRNLGFINPEEIDDYLAAGGYEGIRRALSRKPEEVIEAVIRSGLRGRGGAGFPTGQKWRFAREAPGSPKYLICNADEGDPGAFMDRSVLEGDPHSVLEGMLIAAYAIGAGHGYLYVRSEYPLAIQRLARALDALHACGLLGSNILGSGFGFELKIKEGAGAFVCGEETALIGSIEGRRGMPRPRPPFPAHAGLWGQPTNINNVETFANLPPILTRGADWFAGFGTEKSRGTKTFSVTGKIKYPGLIEVPMGMPLAEVIYSVGGGILGDKKLKAIQTGGPSGGCLPARLLDLPIEYESLAAAGSIMGSGGLVVLDENTCVVDLARYFLTFTQSESCGKCPPCRLGTRQMLAILTDICAGQGRPGDIELLLELAAAIKAGSLCGLGQTAPNPVLTTIRYFREKYEEHLQGRCRAAVCRGLVRAPCTHTCPAGVDVPRYVRLVAEGRFAAARAVVRERIPFAWVCGLVCFHPCEARCRRGLIDEPVAIRALKRAAADFGKKPDREKVAVPATGKKVAVIGSGPAGLTAAYYLRKLGGHEVTVFEALPEPGGMLRVGIPFYRLPEKVLDSEIQRITRLGVRIETGHRVENPVSLLRRGFQAVLVASGAHRGIPLGIPGEEDRRVLDCVTFLRRTNQGEPVRVGPRVAVIGGGNAAVDSARVALRAGGQEVEILYRRTRKEMPADPEEIADAEAEGVRIETLVLPRAIARQNGSLALSLARMRLGKMDDSGRPRPELIPGSDFTREFDTIIAAVGQSPENGKRSRVPTRSGHRIQADLSTGATGLPGLFAAGDAVTGPASVIEAIAAGRQAAAALDRHLGGTGEFREVLAPPETEAERQAARARGVEEEGHRPPMRKDLRKGPAGVFAQVEKGYSRAEARKEARRCLLCDLEET